jgi:hypothetical protein
MGVGPPKTGYRTSFQTTPSCLGIRAQVVSVAGKGETRSRQVWIRKANESEPLMNCRKRRDVIETKLQLLAWDKVWGATYLLPRWWPAERRREPSLGFHAERGNLALRCQGRSSRGSPPRARVPKRSAGADQLAVALKSGNADGAKGLNCPVLVEGQPARGGARD